MVRILAKTEAKRITVHMGSYGGSSRKTMCLWGTAPWLHALQRELSFVPLFAPQVLAAAKTSKKGNISVTGNKKALKESGAYTKSFADLVASEQAGCIEPA